MQSLSQAAAIAGVTKSTIWRALKSGRMSGTRNDDGTWSIDPAETARAFPPRPATANPKQSETALEREVTLLREMLDDMRSQRDQWQQAAQTALRQLPAPARSARSWWKRLAGGSRI